MNNPHFTTTNVKKIFTTPSTDLSNVSPKVGEYIKSLDNDFGQMALGAFGVWGEQGAQPIITGYLSSYKLAQVAAIHGTPGGNA